MWANAKAGVDYDEKQIKRIALAKKKKQKQAQKNTTDVCQANY